MTANLASNLSTEERAAYLAKMLNLGRERVHYDALMSGGSDLANVMELRLAYLNAARKLGDDACMSTYRFGDVPAGAPLSASILVEEQKWALHFLRSGGLRVPAPRANARANIPGPMVEQVLRETRLPLETVEKAFHGQGSDGHRCAVSIALLRAALKGRDSVREPLLRML